MCYLTPTVNLWECSLSSLDNHLGEGAEGVFCYSIKLHCMHAYVNLLSFFFLLINIWFNCVYIIFCRASWSIYRVFDLVSMRLNGLDVNFVHTWKCKECVCCLFQQTTMVMIQLLIRATRTCFFVIINVPTINICVCNRNINNMCTFFFL